MKTLVLGGTGMLGHKVVQTFLQAGEPVSYTIRGEPLSLLEGAEAIEGVDVLDTLQLKDRLNALQPNTIVNCVGVIKQRDEAKAAVPSIAINALLPHLLAEWTESWGGRVIHFSTDCVFNGRKGDYAIVDPADAEDLYGKSKFLGEVKGDNAVTLRTSIIGRELSHYASLVEWFLSQEGGMVKGFTNAIYSGMTTHTMANLVLSIVRDHPNLSGLHHAVSGKINKYELLLILKEAFGMSIQIEPFDDFKCDRSMLPSGLEEKIGFITPDWEFQISEMAKDKTPYRSWR